MTSIICAGFGGQGVLTMGLIIAKTGMDIGENVTWIPSYGSEMRGGTANCNVKVSQEEIGTPFVKEIDILIAMNAPSIDKFENMLSANATVIINSSIIKDRDFREDIQVVSVDAIEISEQNDNIKGANIVMLGALARTGLLFGKDTLKAGVDGFFSLKGKNNPKNNSCFDHAFAAAKYHGTSVLRGL